MNTVPRLFLSGAALACLAAVTTQAVPVGYDIGITTSYANGNNGGLLDAGPAGSPDTGFATFVNNGSSTFIGNLILDGTTPSAVHYNTTLAVTLAPGQSKVLSLNNESSNSGGFNPTAGAGSLDNGIQVELVGNMTLGVNTEAVNLSVYDSQIHSGVFRSANGHSSDSYVLQGGDPYGGDTGDAFELSQTSGQYAFFEASAVPDAGATGSLLGISLAALAGLYRRLQAN